MKWNPVHGAAAIAIAALSGACGGAAIDGPLRGRYQTALETENGRSINGRSINGRSINGTRLSGQYVKSIQWASPKIDGTAVAGVSLKGTLFTGTLGKQKLQPADFVGAIFQAQLTDGSNIRVRFDGYRALATGAGNVNTYAMSYETADGWVGLCGDEPDGSPVMAIPLNGKFDYTQGTASGGSYDSSGSIFSAACRHYASAKCVEMGYQPWATVSGTKLEPYFQACTRMLRADYCGDGTSFTVDGTLINIYDRLGVESDTESWGGEAEWGPKGAICMAPQGYDRFQNTSATPSCYSKLTSTTCGAGFTNAGSLLIDEYWKN